MFYIDAEVSNGFPRSFGIISWSTKALFIGTCLAWRKYCNKGNDFHYTIHKDSNIAYKIIAWVESIKVTSVEKLNII